MSEKTEKKPDSEDDVPAGVPKRGRGAGVAKVLLVVFVVAASAGGAVVGQVAMARMNPPAKKEKAHKADKKDAPYEEEYGDPKEEPPSAETSVLEPMVVDIRSKDGELHHIKIGVAIEFRKPIHEEELKKILPRARDAVISYIRALSYDDATNHQQFDAIRKELGERIARALGKKNVSKVLFTEFVVQ